MSFNEFGKPAETVDFGAGVDYASYEWFKDPPPRSEVLPFFYTLASVLLTLSRRSTPPSLNPTIKARHYTPLPSVIEKNTMCDFALQAAPNVLFGRYKQYGQVRCHHPPPQLQCLIFFKTPSLAGRARVVRRV